MKDEKYKCYKMQKDICSIVIIVLQFILHLILYIINIVGPVAQSV